eukprot:624578-Pelagomonas_calceolata.AAC.2
MGTSLLHAWAAVLLERCALYIPHFKAKPQEGFICPKDLAQIVTVMEMYCSICAGAQALLAAIPCNRPTGRPLWLRMEWNLINLEDLDQALEQQLEYRGLHVEIPEVGRRVEGSSSAGEDPQDEKSMHLYLLCCAVLCCARHACAGKAAHLPLSVAFPDV